MRKGKGGGLSKLPVSIAIQRESFGEADRLQVRGSSFKLQTRFDTPFPSGN